MCLITFAYKSHPRYPLIFAGNRDEIYSRPTEKAHFWKEHPQLLAGQDLESGGTWLGITTDGRFGTVTNFRDPELKSDHGPSRGTLVLDYLTGNTSAESYMQSVRKQASHYSGFNLMLGTVEQLFFLSNKDQNLEKLSAGVYGLSNHRLNNDWPKVRRARSRLRQFLEQDEIDPSSLFSILYDTRPAPDEELPDTGLTLEQERQVSPIYIETEKYGTRSSAVILIRDDGRVYFDERYHRPGEREVERVREEFDIEGGGCRDWGVGFSSLFFFDCWCYPPPETAPTIGTFLSPSEGGLMEVTCI